MEKRIDTNEPRPTASDVLFSMAGDRILALAENRLCSSPYLELRGIACELSAGSLSLYGNVSSFAMKQLAQAALADFLGVVAIANRLEVRPALSCAGKMFANPNAFSRSITLPAPVAEDRVDAQYHGGVLTITLQKAEEAKSQKINVKSS